MNNHWSAPYLGLPWREGGMGRDGVSCWGIVRLVYGDRLGIALPSYRGAPGAEELAEIGAVLAGDATAWPWREIAEGEAGEYDLVTFRLGQIESHAGIIPWPGAFLHVSPGIVSRIERYTDERWRPLVSRFLRHEALPCRTG